MNSAIVTANSVMDILGRKISRNMLFYIENYTKVSDTPLLYSFSITKNNGGLAVLKNSREFVINIVEEEFLEKNKDDIQKATIYEDPTKGLELSEGVKIECPKLKQAYGSIECEKVKEIEMGDSIVFIGRALFKDDIRLI